MLTHQHSIINRGSQGETNEQKDQLKDVHGEYCDMKYEVQRAAWQVVMIRLLSALGEISIGQCDLQDSLDQRDFKTPKAESPPGAFSLDIRLIMESQSSASERLAARPSFPIHRYPHPRLAYTKTH